MRVRETAERIHDADNGAEQSNIRTGRAYGRKRRKTLFQTIDLAHLRNAHGATALFNHFVRLHVALLGNAIKFPKPGFKYAGHANTAALLPGRAAIQGIQITTRPETGFKFVRGVTCAMYQPAFGENNTP